MWRNRKKLRIKRKKERDKEEVKKEDMKMYFDKDKELNRNLF